MNLNEASSIAFDAFRKQGTISYEKLADAAETMRYQIDYYVGHWATEATRIISQRRHELLLELVKQGTILEEALTFLDKAYPFPPK